MGLFSAVVQALQYFSHWQILGTSGQELDSGVEVGLPAVYQSSSGPIPSYRGSFYVNQLSCLRPRVSSLISQHLWFTSFHSSTRAVLPWSLVVEHHHLQVSQPEEHGLHPNTKAPSIPGLPMPCTPNNIPSTWLPLEQTSHMRAVKPL